MFNEILQVCLIFLSPCAKFQALLSGMGRLVPWPRVGTACFVVRSLLLSMNPQWIHGGGSRGGSRGVGVVADPVPIEHRHLARGHRARPQVLCVFQRGGTIGDIQRYRVPSRLP